ncbi:MAG: hypothetical protein EOO38_15350, partial [Cytophagaceae bacterium]
MAAREAREETSTSADTSVSLGTGLMDITMAVAGLPSAIRTTLPVSSLSPHKNSLWTSQEADAQRERDMSLTDLQTVHASAQVAVVTAASTAAMLSLRTTGEKQPPQTGTLSENESTIAQEPSAVVAATSSSRPGRVARGRGLAAHAAVPEKPAARGAHAARLPNAEHSAALPYGGSVGAAAARAEHAEVTDQGSITAALQATVQTSAHTDVAVDLPRTDDVPQLFEQLPVMAFV